jgi:hypothetical protein
VLVAGVPTYRFDLVGHFWDFAGAVARARLCRNTAENEAFRQEFRCIGIPFCCKANLGIRLQRYGQSRLLARIGWVVKDDRENLAAWRRKSNRVESFGVVAVDWSSVVRKVANL